jgi:hypothetical protein
VVVHEVAGVARRVEELHEAFAGRELSPVRDADVRHRVVEPYEAGVTIVVQGQQFDPAVSRIQIVDGPEAPVARPSLDLWESLTDVSDDVTDRFLTRAVRGETTVDRDEN